MKSRVLRAAIFVVPVFVLGLVAACTSYQASGLSGGFSETRLSQTSYQVYFRGNTYTSPARVEKFVLRRAAELALENGFRYFVLDLPQNLDRNDFFGQYSQRGITVRFVEAATTDSADAVVVIQDTDALAGGRLSDKAREALKKFQGN